MLQNRLLAANDLLLRRLFVQPGPPISFREFAHDSRMWRPFQREGSADQGIRIAITLCRPNAEILPAVLPESAKRNEGRLGRKSSLLKKFPARRSQRVFIGADYAFGNGPSRIILPGP